MERWQKAGFGLYIHWPFCQAKCPYCDFNSHVSASIDQQVWRDAYLAEIERYARETGPRVLSSIFFGGGTPSLMEAGLVADIIDAATAAWPVSNSVEITLEANPTSVEINKLKSFRTAGVNRVSVGIQALNDGDLRLLGRMHDAREGLSAIAAAQSVFARSSFDLIYARQHQSLKAWEEELSLALSIAEGHLSLYQLTVEPETVFGARHKVGKLPGLPDEDLSVDMYELTQELCEAAGRPAYEISNHAAHEQESVHNMIYWKSGDYIGIGPGAHGRITDGAGRRMATTCATRPSDWLKLVKTSGSGESEQVLLGQTDRLDEYLLMGLRLRGGVQLGDLEEFTGFSLDSDGLASLESDGLVTTDTGQLSATKTGRLLLNQVIERVSRIARPINS